MKRVFLYKDESNIFRRIESVNGMIGTLNELFDKYKALSLPDMKTEDFKEFIMNPKAFFIKILTNGETLKIGQLELDTQKVYDLFPLPAGVNELVNDIVNFNTQTYFQSHYAQNINNIKILNNELCICDKFKQHIEDTHTFYTETEDQNTALTLLKKIAKDLTALKALQKGGFYNPQDWIKESLIEKKTEKGIEYTENLQKIRLF